MIKAVLFDVDGVLIDSFEANFQFFQALFISLGFKPPTKKEYQSMFHLSLRGVIKEVTKPKNEQELDQLFEKSKEFFKVYPETFVRVSTGVKKTLIKLSQKYKLGIVTSRIRGGAFSMPQTAPLQKYFSVEVYFEDTKNHKPHPEPLLFAAAKLNTDPKEVIYIGDAETDLQAAHAAGMKIILYSKKKNKKADIQTSSFGGIMNAFLKLEG